MLKRHGELVNEIRAKGGTLAYHEIQKVGLGQSCNASLHEGNIYKNR